VPLATPVLAASGTYGAGREAAQFVDLSDLGGIIVKSMTANPWAGKPTPRMCETPSGMLNAIGIQNKGVDHFLAEPKTSPGSVSRTPRSWRPSPATRSRNS
jgi:dihydroorotate dehydrogenase (NAD+) catalytic subunit